MYFSLVGNVMVDFCLQTTRSYVVIFKLQGVVGVISWPIPGGQSDSFSIAFGVV